MRAHVFIKFIKRVGGKVHDEFNKLNNTGRHEQAVGHKITLKLQVWSENVTILSL